MLRETTQGSKTKGAQGGADTFTQWDIIQQTKKEILLWHYVNEAEGIK